MKSGRLIIILLVLSLLLSGCGDNGERDYVSLWCLQSEPAAELLISLAEEYNASRPKGSLRVSVRSFPDEDSLAQGFDTMRPDILLCSHLKAQELSEQGLTREEGFSLQVPLPEYRDYIKDRIPQTGRDIFPVGGNVQLIAAKKGSISLGEKDVFDFEYLCGLASAYGSKNRLPFFTADSFSALIYQALLNEGVEFHALKAYDIKNEEYLRIYNLLAEAAFSGGLISSSYSGPELINSGYLPCAALSGSDLSKLSRENLDFYALDKSDALLSQLSCFVLTLREGRDSDSALAFLSWILSGGRFERLCVESGLVPVTENFVYETDDSFFQFLIKLGMVDKLHLPEIKSDFIANSKDFEADFRSAVSLFS